MPVGIIAALVFLGIVTFFTIMFFFIHQLSHHDRTPYRVFVSPLKRSEIKSLIKLIEASSIKIEGSHYDSRTVYIGDDFIFKTNHNDKSYLNGVRLSYFHEQAISKAIRRRALNVHLLSNTGSLLYGKE